MTGYAISLKWTTRKDVPRCYSALTYVVGENQESRDVKRRISSASQPPADDANFTEPSALSLAC